MNADKVREKIRNEGFGIEFSCGNKPVPMEGFLASRQKFHKNSEGSKIYFSLESISLSAVSAEFVDELLCAVFPELFASINIGTSVTLRIPHLASSHVTHVCFTLVILR